MSIKNEKIGQNFRENTKIRQKSNKKNWSVRLGKMKNLKKFFFAKKILMIFGHTNFLRRTRSSGYVIGPRLGLAERLTGLRT